MASKIKKKSWQKGKHYLKISKQNVYQFLICWCNFTCAAVICREGGGFDKLSGTVLPQCPPWFDTYSTWSLHKLISVWTCYNSLFMLQKYTVCFSRLVFCVRFKNLYISTSLFFPPCLLTKVAWIYSVFIINTQPPVGFLRILRCRISICYF